MPASDGQIRVIIGASLSRDVEATFGQIPKIAQRAAKEAAKALNGATSGGGGIGGAMTKSLRGAANEADKASRDIGKSWDKQLAAANKVAAAQDRIFMKAARDRVREEEKASRDIERIQQKETRTKEREAAKQTKDAAREIERQMAQQDRARDRFATRTSHRAVRFLFPNPIGAFGMASRVGHDLLRGAGVDFSVAGSMSRAVGVQSLATQLSNQGFRAGEKGPAGERVESSTIEAEARSVGKSLSIDPAKLLEAQTKFVDVTGSLDESRKNMKGLAEIAIATGTDFTAMSEAAGNISRHLADTPDKAEKLAGIMRVLAGQGKVGSIEIKDFATQMSKIAAIAPKFAGDVGENITKLTTIAQLSRAEGGSANAAQAATATARFVDTFTTGARLKKFAALGIDPYTDKGHTQLKDPFEIIRQSIIKTKGSATALGDLFKSVMSQRAITALSNAFNQAGGGKAGVAAVNSSLATFGKESAITKEEVAADVAKNQETIAAKAQKFQDQLDEVVSKLATDVIPAFEKMSPTILRVVEAFGNLIDFAAKNPVEAIVLAVAAAIGRAGLESTFRAGVEKLIVNSLGGAGGAAGAAGVGTAEAAAIGGAGTAGTGAGAAAAGVGLGTVAAVVAAAGATAAALYNGYQLLGEVSTDVNDPNAKTKNGGRGGSGTKSQFFWETSKASTPEEYDAQRNKMGLATHEFHGGRAGGAARDAAHNAAHPEEIRINHSSMAMATMAGIRQAGTLSVHVVNMPAGGVGGPPGVSPAGRSPDPGTPRPYRH